MIVISDEPYRPLVFDGREPPEIASPRSSARVIATRWSKAMAIAGERIGYLAISPRLPEAAALRDACTFTNRILGYVNAPAIWQWVVAEVPDAAVDVASYQDRRDLLCDALRRMGYEAPRPQGSFYVFPKTPIPDDVAFMRLLRDEGILAVPGAGFGRGGYMRLSLTVPSETSSARCRGSSGPSGGSGSRPARGRQIHFSHRSTRTLSPPRTTIASRKSG